MYRDGKLFPRRDAVVLRSGRGIAMLVCFILSWMNEGQAQDPHFTQFYANKIHLNPAFAGSQRCPRIALNYRNQWPGLSGTYVTYATGYDQYVKNLGGLGLIVVSDNQADGTLLTNSVGVQYAWHKPINRKVSFSMGMEATYRSRVLDWNKLTFGDQIDPVQGFIHPTNEQNRSQASHIVDFSAGALVYSRNFFAGFAAHHLTTPLEAVTVGGQGRLLMRVTAHAGMSIPLDGGSPYHASDVVLSPNILYMAQGQAKEMNLGLYVKKGPITVGAWYRSGDAFIVLTGFQTKVMRFGYSYDFTTSKLNNGATMGSHELSMLFQIPCKPKVRWRPPDCPSF